MAPDRISILFCDDDPHVLSGLKRSFRQRRSEWDMRFVESAEQALEAMRQSPARVIIADMRMPGMNGGRLLREVRERHPGTIRIILSGQTEQGEMLKSVGAIHQFLQKPIDGCVITHAISRSVGLAAALESTGLQSMLAGLESLPVLSDTYAALSSETRKADCDLSDIVRIIEPDVGLSTKLLQLVNSSFFGVPRRVPDIKTAVGLLGIQRVRSIALSTSVMQAITSESDLVGKINSLWCTSMDVGNTAANIAAEAGEPKALQEDARLAGLLSLVGRAILMRELPDEWDRAYQDALQHGLELTASEAMVFGVPQQAVGAYALGLWAFSDGVVEAVARQATPDLSRAQGSSHPAWYIHQARLNDYNNSLVDRLEPVGVNLEGASSDVSGPQLNRRST